ncbi:MAG: hypothetical protein AAGE52_13205 [Myxococcota bacterium]
MVPVLTLAVLLIVWLVLPLHGRFTRIRTGVEGVAIETLGRVQRIAWADLEGASVDHEMTITYRNGRVRSVPRNARGYLDFVEALHARQKLHIPERVTWSSAPLLRRVFVAGAVVTWGAFELSYGGPLFTGVTFGPGIGTMLYAMLGWARWEVDRDGVRWSNWFWSFDRPRRSTGITRAFPGLLGFPVAQLHERTLKTFGGHRACPAELIRYVVPGAAIVRESPFVRARRPRTRHLWCVWLIVIPVAVSMTALVLMDAGQSPWFAGVLLLVLTRVTLLIRFDASGLERWTLFGRVFEPQEDFRGTKDRFLLRRDGTQVLQLWPSEIEWLARWFPNPVKPEIESYRTMARGQNARGWFVNDYRHDERWNVVAKAPPWARATGCFA